MHPGSLLRRRPSAPMVISIAALFLSLGGVGYAAVSLPANSVGSAQIRNGAVTYKKIEPNSVGRVRLANFGVINSKLANNSVSFEKIQPGAVGHVRANLSQLQARVNGTCTAGSAMASISQSGGANCVATAPNQIGTVSSGQVTVAPGDTNTTIASETLPGHSSFVVFGTVNATVVPATGVTNQWVKVTCTVNPGGTGTSRTGSATTRVTSPDPDSLNIPIVAPTGAASGNTTANVICTFANSTGTAPTVTATASLNAITTAANS